MLLLLGFVGFVAHAAIEALILVFESQTFSEEDMAGMVEMMSGSSIKWVVGVFVTLTALPVVLALRVESRGAWMATFIIAALLTAAHTLHYVGEMTEGINGVGIMSLLVHIFPSIWACILILKWRKLL